MATPIGLLTVPLEIRYHIYSYILLNEHVIDMIAADVTCSHEHGLFLACPQLHSEALKYYYDSNTFQLSLNDPTYSPYNYPQGHATLMRRLGRMRNLHVEVGPKDGFLFGNTTRDVYILPYVEREHRWRRFVEQLNQVKPRLNRLVIVDRYICCPAWYQYANYGHMEAPADPSVLENRIPVIIQLVEPLKDEVENLTVEIRSAFVWTPYVEIGNSPYKVLRSFTLPPSHNPQS